MLEILLMILAAVVCFFVIARVCMFFANRNVDPFPDIPEDATEEERELELERQRRTVQGMYQMRECMKGKILSNKHIDMAVHL